MLFTFQDHYLNEAPAKRQKNRIDLQQISAAKKKYRKQSTAQKRQKRLGAQWIDMDFVPLEVVSQKDFNNLISNDNTRIYQKSNETVGRELKKPSVEVG